MATNLTYHLSVGDRLTRQSAIDQKRTALERNVMGQFATPPVLALDIVRATLAYRVAGTSPIRFLEPAVGTGSFYEALLRETEPSEFARAVGVELDSLFADAARELWVNHPLLVVEGDATDPEVLGSERFNLVITNPPYVRHHHLDAETKSRLEIASMEATGLKVSGLAGLYVHFLLINHGSLEPGALSSWLIPSEFMDVNYGASLLRYLTSAVTLLKIHRYDTTEDTKFADALVSSAVVVFCNKLPDAGHMVDFSFGGSMLDPVRSQSVPLAVLADGGKWTRFPFMNGETTLERQSASLRLGDLLEVRRGIATGANGFFIMSRKKANDMDLEPGCLRPVLPSPRYLGIDIVERDPDGYPALDDPLVLIDCPHSDSEGEAQHPRLSRYLTLGVDSGVTAKYLPKNRKIWHRQEQRDPSPILCTYMGRGEGADSPFRFILNKSDAIATNGYLMLYPTPTLKQWLDVRGDDGLRALLELLAAVTGDHLREEGRSYGGGLHKIEPRELANVDLSQLCTELPSLAKLLELFRDASLAGQTQLELG